jgi:cyclase
MLTKRIIPCLDVKNNQTVKGVSFENIREVGDPVEMGAYYSEMGADELVFLDITATKEKRKTLVPLVRRIAENLNIPFTVGGGVSSVEDAGALLEAGADKITINSTAVRNPKILDELATTFGSQFVVLAVDAKWNGKDWQVYISGGSVPTTKCLFSWTREAEVRGCGEIMFTSIDHDGRKEGFAIDPLKRLSNTLNIPVIASGGAGEKQHFVDLFQHTNTDAALAASIFHFKEIEIKQLKQKLKNNGIEVRL